MSLIKSFQAHSSSIPRIRQSPFNSDLVATASGDTLVKVWNVTSSCNTSWELIRTYSNHTSYVFGLEWIDADTVASGGYDKTINIWSKSSGQNIRTISTGQLIWCLQLLSNGFYLAAGLQNGNINIYNKNTGSVFKTLIGHSKVVNDFVLTSSNLLASSSNDKSIKIWDLTTYTLKFNLTGHTSPVRGLKLVSYEILASGSDDFKIFFWNITSGFLIRNLLGHTGIVYYSVDLLSDGQTFLSGSYDQTIKLWNVTNGQILKTINSSLSIRSLTVLVNLTVRGKRNHAFFLNFKTYQCSEY
jgi:WD40 repeat protein